MVVLSIIPAVGAVLVWLPAVLYLFLTGHTVAAALLLAWCAVVVGSLDNLLRPRLIGSAPIEVEWISENTIAVRMRRARLERAATQPVAAASV